MKNAAFLVLLALALAVSSCGTRTPTTTVETTTSGSWEAQLIGGTEQASLLNFVTQFTLTNVNGVSEPITVTGFAFINAESCFVSAENEAGTASLNSNSSNQVTGSMTYTITSGSPAGNVLTLTTSPSGGISGTSTGAPGTILTLSNGVVWGNWTLTGPCTSGLTQPVQGTFIMCQNAPTCTVP